MVSNKKLAQMFAGGARKGRSNSMFIEDDVVYSYGHHFPIAVRRRRGEYDFNEDRYSNTTARHKSHIRNALSGNTIFSSNTSGLLARIAKKIR
jgi:hypothetical protein